MEADPSATGRPSRTPGSGVTNTFALPGSGGQRTQPRAAGAVSGGTSAQPALKRASGDTQPQAPVPVRGQTVAQYLPEASGPKTTPSDPALAAGRRQSRTLVERAAPISRDDAANAPSNPLVNSQPERAGVPSRAGRKANASAKKIPAWALVVGGGIWTAIVLGFGLLLLAWFRSEPPSAATGPTPVVAPVATTAPPAPKQPVSSAPPRAKVPGQRPGDLALKTSAEPKPGVEPSRAERRPSTVASNAPREPESVDPPNAEAVSRFDLRAESLSGRAATNEAKPARNPEPNRPDFGPLLQKPIKVVRVKETLDKVLGSPRSHAAKVIMPAGMYELTRSRYDRPYGPRKYAATEAEVPNRNRVDPDPDFT